MRRIKFIAVAFLLAVGAVALWYLIGRLEQSSSPLTLEKLAVTTPTASPNFRIAAYNIAHGRGGKLGASNWDNDTREELLADLDKIAEQINKLAPDALVLNEVDFDASWSHGVDQAEYIATKCGFPYVLKQRNYGVSLPFYQLHFGNALLSKYPIENKEPLRFEPYSAKESYLAGNHDGFIADLVLQGGRIAIVGVHLEYRDEPTRVLAAQKIAEAAAKRKHPVIALGDFNSSLGTPINNDGVNTIKLLIDAGFTPSMPGANAPLTFPSENPERKIDWILGANGARFSNAKAVKSPHSDHLMVVAEVKLSNEPAPTSP